MYGAGQAVLMGRLQRRQVHVFPEGVRPEGLAGSSAEQTFLSIWPCSAGINYVLEFTSVIAEFRRASVRDCKRYLTFERVLLSRILSRTTVGPGRRCRRVPCSSPPLYGPGSRTASCPGRRCRLVRCSSPPLHGPGSRTTVGLHDVPGWFGVRHPLCTDRGRVRQQALDDVRRRVRCPSPPCITDCL